ncbi:MAG: TIGR03000 domain-containing protein [Pirellulaceae bacterium]|nr:TIGR03000 domain-containing protein [Pirellulaceae bacterium]
MKITVLRVASTVLLCITAVIASGPAALAGWGSLGGSYGGSYGGGSFGGSSGYVAGYGSYGGSSGGSVGQPFTPVRSVLRGIHNHIAAKIDRHQARRAFYSSYGSVGYASSGYGSSGYGVSYGGSTGGYSYGSTGSDVSYGSVGSTSYGSVGSASYSESYGSVGSTIYQGAANDSGSGYSVLSNLAQEHDADAVYLTVSVPNAAAIYVNGRATTSSGSVRQYVSRGLVAGKSYKFELRAELPGVDGQVMTEERTVVVTAGGREHLQFAFADSASPVETSLTLNVPEGAKVVLAGNPTRAIGTTRTYQSKQLMVGQVWDDYVVEVELDGQVKRQSIRLIGGDSLELSFNFSASAVDQLAATR